jgi:hypothetical protein
MPASLQIAVVVWTFVVLFVGSAVVAGVVEGITGSAQ